jgi:hypothetical protein
MHAYLKSFGKDEADQAGQASETHRHGRTAFGSQEA